MKVIILLLLLLNVTNSIKYKKYHKNKSNYHKKLYPNIMSNISFPSKHSKKDKYGIFNSVSNIQMKNANTKNKYRYLTQPLMLEKSMNLLKKAHKLKQNKVDLKVESKEFQYIKEKIDNLNNQISQLKDTINQSSNNAPLLDNFRNESYLENEEETLENLKFDLTNHSINKINSISSGNIAIEHDYSKEFERLSDKISSMESKIDNLKKYRTKKKSEIKAIKIPIKNGSNNKEVNKDLPGRSITDLINKYENSEIEKKIDFDAFEKAEELENRLRNEKNKIEQSNSKLSEKNLSKIDNLTNILIKNCGEDLKNCYFMKRRDLLLQQKSQRAIIKAIFRLAQKKD